MDKHKCGTCRFFEESEMPGSGWCNHPQRRTSIETLLMVRKGELACRNGWDNDLWEAVRAPGDPAPIEPLAMSDFSRKFAPGQPGGQAASQSMGEDVVVDQAPVMPDLNDRTALLAYDTRLAIDEARERHRQRNASPAGEAADAPPEPRDGDTAATPEPRAAEQPAGTPNLKNEPDPLIRVGEHGRAAGDVDTGDNPFDEIPVARSDIDLPRPSRTESPPVIPMNTSGEAEVESSQLAEPWFANGDPRRARLLSEVLAQRAQLAKRRGQGRFGRPRPQEIPPPVPVNERTEIAPAAEPESAPEHEQLYVLLRDPRERRRRTETDVVVGDDNQVVAEAEREIVEPEPSERSAEALPILDDEDERLTIPTVDISPEVPRMCRTCRDFRPSETGDRGWCTNKWAFSHRRMVNADELPCLTSLGCWWLPHDVIWLSTADVGRHSEPTPLVDRWLTERTAGDEVARPGMRRRQS